MSDKISSIYEAKSEIYTDYLKLWDAFCFTVNDATLLLSVAIVRPDSQDYAGCVSYNNSIFSVERAKLRYNWALNFFAPKVRDNIQWRSDDDPQKALDMAAFEIVLQEAEDGLETAKRLLKENKPIVYW